MILQDANLIEAIRRVVNFDYLGNQSHAMSEKAIEFLRRGPNHPGNPNPYFEGADVSAAVSQIGLNLANGVKQGVITDPRIVISLVDKACDGLRILKELGNGDNSEVKFLFLRYLESLADNPKYLQLGIDIAELRRKIDS